MGKVDQLYKDYIQNKKVIFVGPASTLLNRELGNWIDSYDVVVRMNGSYTIPEKFQSDFGSKCHVLYTNGAFARGNTLPIKKMINQVEFKFLCMKVADKMNKYAKIMPNGVRKLNLPIISNFKRKGLFTGMQAINELVQLNPRKLFVTGIDFYQHKYNYYSEEYGTDLYTGIPGSHAHGLNRNFQFLKYIYNNYNFVKVDSFFLKDFLKKEYIETDPSQEVRTLKNKNKK